MKASATAMIAVGMLAAGSATAAAGSATASGCAWQKQVMAKASPPPVEEQAATTATPVDPMLLAEMKAREGKTLVPTDEAAKQ